MSKEQPEPTFDENGYPTEEALSLLEKWDVADPFGALKFMQAAWYYPEMAENILKPAEREIIHVASDPKHYTYFRFATGGWSGNEELIAAFRLNNICWAQVWRMSASGGLHIFGVKTEDTI